VGRGGTRPYPVHGRNTRARQVGAFQEPRALFRRATVILLGNSSVSSVDQSGYSPAAGASSQHEHSRILGARFLANSASAKRLSLAVLNAVTE